MSVASMSIVINAENELYQNMVSMLNEQGCVSGITEYFEENGTFTEESYVGESYDGVIYKIPLQEWTEKTGMVITVPESRFYGESIEVLTNMIDNYCGTIEVSKDEGTNEYFVFISGGC
jgi:hypothetical protein